MGLERSISQVAEDDSVVEVCVIASSSNEICPIEFAFNVNLATSDGTAGIYCCCN